MENSKTHSFRETIISHWPTAVHIASIYFSRIIYLHFLVLNSRETLISSVLQGPHSPLGDSSLVFVFQDTSSRDVEGYIFINYVFLPVMGLVGIPKSMSMP